MHSEKNKKNSRKKRNAHSFDRMGIAVYSFFFCLLCNVWTFLGSSFQFILINSIGFIWFYRIIYIFYCCCCCSLSSHFSGTRRYLKCHLEQLKHLHAELTTFFPWLLCVDSFFFRALLLFSLRSTIDRRLSNQIQTVIQTKRRTWNKNWNEIYRYWLLLLLKM